MGSRRTKGAVGLAAALVGTGLAIPAEAQVQGSSATPTTPSTTTTLPVGGNIADQLGITATPDGWISYQHLVTSGLDLADTHASVRTGTRLADGTCSYPEAADSTSTGNLVEEVVAVNPKACLERVTSGVPHLDSAGQLARKPVSYPSEHGHSAAARGVEFLPCSDSLTSSVYQHETAGSGIYSHYFKSAWIDPVCITITSLTNDLRWKDTPNASTVTVLSETHWSEYQFAYDGWTTTQHPAAPPSGTGVYTSFGGTAQYKNTDFQLMLDALALAALGPSGPVAVFAACGFDHSPAYFTHIIGQKGYRGGGWWVGAGETATGGCSNLVHNASWMGSGFTS